MRLIRVLPMAAFLPSLWAFGQAPPLSLDPASLPADQSILTLAEAAVPPPAPTPSAERRAAAGGQGRYFFNLLDHRSRYGTGFFPEYFRQTGLDVEHEFRIDYFHGEDRVRREDEIESEIEWAFGNLTLTIEGEWETEREFNADEGTWERTQGWDTVKFKAHHPIFQYVSADDVFDYTLVAKLSVGVPLFTDVHHDDYELNPLLGQLLRVGEHFSVQTWTGVNFVVGPNEGGQHEFRYGALFGWNVYHDELPLPGIESFTPLLELDGQTFLGNSDYGHNRLFGVAGFRFNLDPIGPMQPRLGIGYLFPIDQGARQELDWGVQASVIFEF